MDSAIVRCAGCGALNRVAAARMRDKPVCGKCKKTLIIPDRAIDVTSATFEKDVLQWPGAVLAEFWSPTCGHCKNLAPVLDELARDQAGMVKVAKINVQYEQDLARTFSIMGVPTLILYRNGKPINQISGAMRKGELLQWITQSLRD